MNRHGILDRSLCVVFSAGHLDVPLHDMIPGRIGANYRVAENVSSSEVGYGKPIKFGS
jgi:hypothetical protein